MVYKILRILLFIFCGTFLKIGFDNMKSAWDMSKRKQLTNDEKRRAVCVLSTISVMFLLGSFLCFVLGYYIVKVVEGA